MKFFVSNLTEDGTVSSLGYAFDHRYKNQIYIMFLRSLYTFLWGLLCIIPGIYKGYEYRMIPYLLTEYPDIDKDRAFAISKQMMYGYKMKAFLLDLSFIGWWLLNTLTCGLLGIFFVGPYYHSTAAAFYEALKGFHGIPGLAAPLWTSEMQGAQNAQTTEVTYEAARAEEESSDTQEEAEDEVKTDAVAADPVETGSESFGESSRASFEELNSAGFEATAADASRQDDAGLLDVTAEALQEINTETESGSDVRPED